MSFRQFVEDAAAWDAFQDVFFVGEYEGQASDFYCWLRQRWSANQSPQDYDYKGLERLFADWKKSTVRGTWCAKMDRSRDRKRRKDFGPGKYWAPTSAGVFLNKNFVKGWRGINPANP